MMAVVDAVEHYQSQTVSASSLAINAFQINTFDKEMNKPHINIVIPHFIADKGFIFSQIIKPFGANLSAENNITIWSFSVNAQADDKFKLAAETFGITCRFVPVFLLKQISYIPFFFKLWHGLRAERNGKVFLYSRELYGGIINILAKTLIFSKVVVVYDFRATQVEEVEFSYSGLKRLLVQTLWRFYESIIAKRSDRFNCVTPELKGYVEKRYSARVNTVIPCCVDDSATNPTSSRTYSRNLYGFSDDDVVLVYSGGIDAWQCFSETTSLVSKLSEINGKIKFLVLTPQPDKAKKIISALGVSATVMSVKQDQVKDILRCGDVGLLLRKPHIVNQVAFPIKFAEYLSSGLPVISTNALPAIGRIIEKYDVGAIVDIYSTDCSKLADFISKVSICRDNYSARCTRAVEEQLTWDCYSELHKALFAEEMSFNA